jgi:pyruvate,water dikinase
VFGAACRYFTEVQTSLPAASMSEVLFTQFYTRLVRRKDEPEPSAFVLGADNAAARGDKALWDLAAWLKDSPLAEYARATPASQLAADLARGTAAAGLPAEAWAEWRTRFERHLAEHAQTAYELDFAHPTPAEAPAPLLETVKLYLAGEAPNPHERQQQAVERREAAARAVLARLGWPRRQWFERLLRWAQETAPMREDSIFDIGMEHGVVRRLLGELGRRLAASGAITQPDHIYWLEESEVEAAVHWLARGEPLASYADRIGPRQAEWQAQLKIMPPVMLPERSGWQRLIHGGEATTADGQVVLRGVGTSAGQVTAPACVLLGPEDFDQMRAGAVLVAVTTTPAWTPLFSLASAVVTDIGGPLSHSSIVAREYGIPAVMAARNATRYIHTGDLITVDGATGKVTVAAR